VAVFPTTVPPKAVTGPVVFVNTPTAVPVTFSEKVQEAPAASVAPDRLMLLEPGTAVIVPPPQEPVKPLGVDTARPDGNVSVNAMPVRGPGLAFGFVIVKFSAVLAPNN